MKEKFIQFLKDNNAYDAFIKNLLNIGYCKINSLFTINPTYWISSAFFWNKTSEGHDYWKRIEQAWEIILNKED